MSTKPSMEPFQVWGLHTHTRLMLRRLAGHRAREELTSDPQCAWEKGHRKASLEPVRC